MEKVSSGSEAYEAEVRVTSASSARVVTPIFGVTIEVGVMPGVNGGHKVRLRVVDPGYDPELAGREVCVPIFAVTDAVQRPPSHPYGGLGHGCLEDAAAVAAAAQMLAGMAS